MTDKHLEAAAAAIRIMVNPAEAIARAVIDAYRASLAAEGEDDLVEAMLDGFGGHCCYDIVEATRKMRAALAVVRAADAQRLAELERDAARYRWLRERGIVVRADKHSIVETSGGEILDARIDKAIAACATEGGGHE